MARFAFHLLACLLACLASQKNIRSFCSLSRRDSTAAWRPRYEYREGGKGQSRGRHLLVKRPVSIPMVRGKVWAK